MMNYNDFLNQPILNKNQESGLVLSFDENHIVIQYPSTKKIYHPDVAFKNHFLVFENHDLQRLIEQDQSEKEAASKKKEAQVAENNRKYLAKRRRVNLKYSELCRKNRLLLILLGCDFVYPPLKRFEKKYQSYIDGNLQN